MRSILLCLLNLIVIGSFSQTHVSGNIAANTTWAKTNSPYILDGNVGVPAGYTLTIEKGVVIERSNNYNILVNGALICNGSAEDSIAFTSGSSLSIYSRFFIEFQKSNLDNSALNFITFRNGSVTNNISLSTASVNNTGTLVINGSGLRDGYFVLAGLNYYVGLNILNSTIEYAYVLHKGAGRIMSIANTIINNSTVGGATDSENETNLDSCQLFNSKLPLTSNVHFNNTDFNDCRLGEDGHDVGCLAYINNCNFINTAIFHPLGFYNITNSDFTVDKQIYNLIDDAITDVINVTGLGLKDCNLTNTSSVDYNGLLTGVYYPGYDTIIRNSFTGWYDAVSVNLFYTMQLDSNNFIASDRYHIVNKDSKDFSALNNYYELNPGKTVEDMIYHANDDLSLGLITYIPYSTNPVVLPLQLLDFTVHNSGTKAVLNWKTSSEQNTDFFNVEHSTGAEYKYLAMIQAAGSSNGVKQYSFVHDFPSTGVNYYRLKMIDKDGKYTYSFVIKTVFVNSYKNISIAPNPAGSFIVVTHPSATNAHISITDLSGKLVKQTTVASNAIQTRIELSVLKAGVYFLTWKSSTSIQTQKFIVQ